MARPIPNNGVLKIREHMLNATGGGEPSLTINIASNESAYGPSPMAAAAGKAAMQGVERYSETATNTLSEQLASHFDINPDGVVCGFGSDEILSRIGRAYLSPGDELVYSRNGYQKFPNYAYVNNAQPVAARDRDFTVDVDQILSCVTDRTRVVMIANPDNPTGTYISANAVRRLHAALPGDILLVLDSAYLEYVEASDFEDPTNLVESANNVVMTRTFSKIYGLAGVRLGWAYAPVAIAKILRRAGITFPVSSPALQSGCAALHDTKHVAGVHAKNVRVRRLFTDTLDGLGLNVYASQTNFVLVSFPDPARSAQLVYDYLTSRGIITRRFSSTSFSDCIRFTIGLENEMARTAEALNAFFRKS